MNSRIFPDYFIRYTLYVKVIIPIEVFHNKVDGQVTNIRQNSINFYMEYIHTAFKEV